MINVTDQRPLCYIGLPQWNHPEWGDGPLAASQNASPLRRYARYFSSVEGNTTFYGLPSPDAIKRWRDDAGEHFRFCFKFPKSISHENSLRNCADELDALFKCAAQFEEQLGLLSLQLPDSFSPNELPTLETFLRNLPEAFKYSIEVRNPGFFQKDDQERHFNQLLMETGVNRTTFDTRALFKHPAEDPATREALTAKPNLPVHVLATGQNPMVRFITAMDWESSTNYLTPWVNKTVQWLNEGRSPFIFLHTPDNAQAPEVAQHFVALLEQHKPGQTRFTDWPDQSQQQSALF